MRVTSCSCREAYEADFWICASEFGFQGGDLQFFSDAVFAGTVELLLRNVCKTFCGARFDFLESLRKLSGCFDVTLLVINFCEIERVFLMAVNLYFLTIILCLANIISFLLLIINNGR